MFSVKKCLDFVAQAMSDKEKSRFEDMAKQDKVRYDQEMMHYMPGKRGKKKDPNAPKRPPWVYCQNMSMSSYYDKYLVDLMLAERVSVVVLS